MFSYFAVLKMKLLIMLLVTFEFSAQAETSLNDQIDVSNMPTVQLVEHAQHADLNALEAI